LNNCLNFLHGGIFTDLSSREPAALPPKPIRQGSE